MEFLWNARIIQSSKQAEVLVKSNPNPGDETRNTRAGAMSVEEMLKFRALPLREKILAVEKLADAERARKKAEAGKK